MKPYQLDSHLPFERGETKELNQPLPHLNRCVEICNTTTASSWCVVAKIRDETPFGEGGRELKAGSKHFLPGAKVYVVDRYPGMCATVKVVGHHRKSHRLMTIDLHVKYLTSLESKVVYKPYVLERIEEFQMMGDSVLSEEDAEKVKRAIKYWIDAETK